MNSPDQEELHYPCGPPYAAVSGNLAQIPCHREKGLSLCDTTTFHGGTGEGNGRTGKGNGRTGEGNGRSEKSNGLTGKSNGLTGRVTD